MSASGTFSWCVGPFLIGWIYDDYGTYWTFTCSILTSLLAFPLILLSYKPLVPFEVRRPEEDND